MQVYWERIFLIFRKQHWQHLCLPGAALEIKCSFYLRRVSEIWRKSLDLTRYPELSQCSCKKRRGKEHDPDFYKVPARFRPSSAICCGGASAAGGRHSPVPADKLKPCHKVKGPGVVYSGTGKPKIGFHFWIVSVNQCWEEEVGSLSRGRLRLPGGGSASAGGSKTQEEMRKSCWKFSSMGWVTSTAGGSCRSTCSAWSGMWDFLGQRFSVQHFSSSLGSASVSATVGNPASVVYPCEAWNREGCMGVAGVRSRNQHSREHCLGCKPLLASDTCIWGSQPVPQTESHQDKVENFDKSHHFILELDRISMWTEET